MLAWLIYFSFGMINLSISPFLTPIIRDLNLTYSQVGAILGAWQLTYIVVAFAIGLLIDRIGIKYSLAIGVTMISLSVALRGVATSFEIMFISVAIFGIGGPMISIGLPKLIASYFSGAERGKAVGIYVTGSSAGSAFSLAIANSVLIPMVGTWQKAMYLYALFGILVLIIWLFAGRETDSIHKHSPKQSRISLTLLKNRNMWIIIIIGFSGFFVGHGLRNWLPKILELKGMTPTTAGFTTSLYTIINMIGSLIIPNILYRVRSRKLLITIIILLGGFGLFLIATSTANLFWVGLILSGFTQGGMLPLMMIFLMELPEIGAKYMGSATGIYFTVGEVGGFSAPLLMGYLKDITGSFLIGMSLLILVLEAMLPLVFLFKETAFLDRNNR